MTVKCSAPSAGFLLVWIFTATGAWAESMSKPAAHTTVQTQQAATSNSSTKVKPNPELSQALEPNEALFQAIREGSASLKAFYTRQWLSGDRDQQRADLAII